MPRIIYCQVLKREAEGLDRPPHPGALGERIFQNVSREGWNQWLQRLAIIINESEPKSANNCRIVPDIVRAAE